MHSGGDDLERKFGMRFNGAQGGGHQAEFSSGAGDEADAAFFVLTHRACLKPSPQRSLHRLAFMSELQAYSCAGRVIDSQ